MSKSNLENVSPNIFEVAEVSWESSGNKQGGWYCQDEEHVRSIFRKIMNIPVSWKDMEDVTFIPKVITNWQMRNDVVIPPESWAEADETVIPFWYGTKPQKRSLWKSVTRLFR